MLKIKVNNKKTVRLLAYRNFKAAKSRNIIAIIAIALTTVLFTSLFSISVGLIETFQNQTMRQSGSDGHAVFKFINQQQYEKIKTHPLIKQIGYDKAIDDDVNNIEFAKRSAIMRYMDETAMNFMFCTPTVGKAPTLANEIAVDTKTLDLFGLPHEIGIPITIDYTIKGKQYKTDFVVSGFWEADQLSNYSLLLVSEEFTKVNADKLLHTLKEDNYYSGSINVFVKFRNSFNLRNKMERIVTEIGYTIADDDYNTPLLETDIICNVNWAYLGSNSIDLGTAIGLSFIVLLIIFTGYLIIYNVFQISVQKDIRFYGLIKTIGTTGKQIKTIIRTQALILGLIAIPFGLIIGFFVGKAILPFVLDTTTYSGDKSIITINPIIFIGSSLFSIITILISTRIPGKMASKVSPIEAVRYSDTTNIKKKNKKSTNGGKIYRMSLSNLSRNRKRTIITILSLSLSLVLLNSVFTLTNSFDLDKFISLETDFIIGNSNYFNITNGFHYKEDELSNDFVEAVKNHKAFEEGGKLYYNVNSHHVSIDSEKVDAMNFASDGKPSIGLYGFDDFVFGLHEVIQGELDFDKLSTGKYIIEGLEHDSKPKYNIGDKIIINVKGEPHEYELLASIKKSYINSARYNIGDIFYLPLTEYFNIIEEPVLMSYIFNVNDDMENEMETFIKNYTENIDKYTNYESKQTYINEFNKIKNMFIIVGSALSGIVGLIGILNFINSILTGIFVRRKEFATMQSIGMEKKQLIKMLVLESLYYAIFTIIVSFILAIVFSVFGVKLLISNLFFVTYKFVILPLIIAYPILLILAIFIPLVCYISTGKQSIVEMLREIE